VLLLGAMIYCYSVLADRQLRLDNTYLRKLEVERELSTMEEDASRIALLDDWNQAGIVWLDGVYYLTARFPEPETIRLTSLIGDPLSHSPTTRRAPKPPARSGTTTEEEQDKAVAKLSLVGIMTEDFKVVDTLNQRFVDDNHYGVDPKIAGPNTGADRARFP